MNLMVAQQEQEAKNMASLRELLESAHRQVRGFLEQLRRQVRDNQRFDPREPQPNLQGQGEAQLTRPRNVMNGNAPYIALPDRGGADVGENPRETDWKCIKRSWCTMFGVGCCLLLGGVLCPAC